MESVGAEEIKPKRACIVCGKEYEGEETVCPEDRTPLTPLSSERTTGAVIADRYEILSTIGTGGMGVVYKARHRLMKRVVAIKMLHAQYVSTASTLRRFQQEAQAASSLNHPHILTVYDFGLTEDGQPYLVMDFLEGRTLAEVLTEEGNLPVERAVDIFTQACAGLSHAHQKGIIHRDIKPSNIMLVTLDDRPDFVKIVDFGIAKILSMEGGAAESDHLTRTGEVFGSPLYMSPEQCRGKELDPRTDIYSLGCVLYRTLTGAAPFMGQDQLECMFKHVNETPSPFSEVCPDLNLPAGLEKVVFKALAKNPGERYQTMHDFRQALGMFSQHTLTPSASLPPVQEPSTPPAGSLERGQAAAPLPAGAQTGPTSGQGEMPAIARPSVQEPQAAAGPASVTRKAPPKTWLTRAAAGFCLGMIGAVIGLYLTHRLSPPTGPSRVSGAGHAPPAGAPGAGTSPVQPTQPPSPEQAEFDQQMSAAASQFNSGNYVEAERTARQAEHLAKGLPGDGRQYASSMQLLGNINYAQGNYGGAAAYFQQALAYRQKIFGDGSAESAATKTSLGRTLSAQGRYAAARSYLSQASSALSVIYSPSDTHLTDVLSAIADVDIRQRRYNDAVQDLTRALNIKQLAGGSDTLDVAVSLNDLGQAYQLERNYAQAESLYKRALAIRRKRLAADNPAIADTLYCLGALYLQTHRYAESQKTLQQALSIQERSLDPSNPRIAQTRQLLSGVSKVTGGNTRRR